MPKITPFLWFDNNLEEAIPFYTSIFKNSKVHEISRLNVEAPDQPGKILMAAFELEGQEFLALNGGPEFHFNESFSLYVNVETQAEVDFYWNKLTEGGEESQCGWLKDKFGLSWQIVPTILNRLLSDPDQEKAGRAMQAMLQMHKLDIAKLQAAFNG